MNIPSVSPAALVRAHPQGGQLLVLIALCIAALFCVGTASVFAARAFLLYQRNANPLLVELQQLQLRTASLTAELERQLPPVLRKDAALLPAVRRMADGMQLEIQSADERGGEGVMSASLHLELLATWVDWLRFREGLVQRGLRPLEEIAEPSGRVGLVRIRGLYASAGPCTDC